MHQLSCNAKESELRLVIDNMPSLIAYVDSARRYRLINKAYQDFFGIKESQIIGKHVKNGVGYETYGIIKKYIDIVLTGEETYYEEYCKDVNGVVHLLEAKIIPYIDSNDEQNGYLVIVNDITEQRNLQNQIKDLNSSLEKKVIDRTRKLQEKTIALENALEEIRTLREILPICSFCKKIRDDKGYWEQVDVYIERVFDTHISHGICPDCMKEHYSDIYEKNRSSFEKE